MATTSIAPATATFETWVKHSAHQVEQLLEQHLPSSNTPPEQLHTAMRYAVLDGGKRIRPLLALAAGQLCGAVPQTALYAGCAVELIHAYSLVHDDMPCMDNDVLRRGKPTTHIAYGQATAMLVGDALQALAFEWLTQPMAGVDARANLQMVRVLAQASGAAGMVGGQQLDLLAENNQIPLEQLQTLHRKKTGALLQASIQIGAVCGYAYTMEPGLAQALSTYGDAIGLGFQIADDVLDATADAQTLGKTPGKDESQGKSTYVSMLGLEQAQAQAQHCLSTAINALAPYGDRALRLNQLAHLIVNRSH